MRKVAVFIICFFSLFIVSAQESKIVKLLNAQLSKEIKNYPKYDSLKILQPFYINDQKKLFLEYKKYDPNIERWEIKKQEVLLSDITSIGKDINILFLTNSDKVLTTTKITNKNSELLKTDVSYKNLFFTEIFEEKQNEKFRDKIIKAFKEQGYLINSDFWYD